MVCWESCIFLGMQGIQTQNVITNNRMDAKRFASPFSGEVLRWTDRIYRAD